MPSGWLGMQSVETFSGSQGSLSKVDHLHFLQQTPVAYHVGLSIWLCKFLHNIATSFPQSRQYKREQDRSHTIFCDLDLKVIHHHFHRILLVTQVNPIQCLKELQHFSTAALLTVFDSDNSLLWETVQFIIARLASFLMLDTRVTPLPQVETTKISWYLSKCPSMTRQTKAT